MTACPGACNAAWRASGDGEPREGDPAWCSTCKASIRRRLTDLDYQAAMLAFRADGHHEQPEQPSRRSGNHPSPSQAMDDIEELTGWLWDWEDAYRKETGLPASFHHGYLPDVRSAVVAWLAERLDGILELPFAADFGREVNARHWELLGKNNARPPRHGLVNCPRCDHKLAWLDGRDGLRCGGCNRHMTMDEYREELAHAASRLEQAG